MNKLIAYFIFPLMLSIASPAFAANRAVQISIGGIGPGVDIAAFETVKQVIGYAVANGVIDNFIVSGYGIEGGFSACAQASPRTNTYNAFVRQLQSITPNKTTTGYSLRRVAACPGN